MNYITKNGSQLRTKSGGKAAQSGVDKVILSGVTRWLHDETWNEIDNTSPNYGGLYIRMQDLTTPPPNPDPDPNPTPGDKPYTVDITVELEGYAPDTKSVSGVLKPL